MESFQPETLLSGKFQLRPIFSFRLQALTVKQFSFCALNQYEEEQKEEQEEDQEEEQKKEKEEQNEEEKERNEKEEEAEEEPEKVEEKGRSMRDGACVFKRCI